MTYGTNGERDSFIAGLRDLAEFLESHPDVPAPSATACIHVFPPAGNNEERRAEIDVIASRIDTQAFMFGPGHYVASRYFGQIEYRAVAIDRLTSEADGA